MAVTLQTSSTATGTAAASIVITKPTGTVSGDFLIASFCKRNGTTTITAPSGWTLLKTINPSAGDTSSLYYLKAGGSEPADYTWSWTGSVDSKGGMVRIDGQDPAFTFGAENTNWRGNADTSGSTISTSAGITPTTANSLILLFLTDGSNASSFSTYAIATSNPTWAEAYDAVGGSFTAVACASGLRAAATDTGVGSAESTGFNEEATIFLVAVSPVAVVGPANVKTVGGLATASVKTVGGLAIASVKTIGGLA